MIIKLPKTFYYSTDEAKNFAYVSNGVLCIHGHINYEDLMYSLTYAFYGYEKCKYCGRDLTPSNRTLDHIYPRSYGGISIPDNLLPCCKSCNYSKSDMAPWQFYRWRKLKTENEKKQYFYKCSKDNHKTISRGYFILPKEWITMYDVSHLVEVINFSHLDQFKIQKVKEYYDANHQYNHPIVVSSNDWLLKGKHILYHAKQINEFIVPAIVLENVVVIRSTS